MKQNVKIRGGKLALFFGGHGLNFKLVGVCVRLASLVLLSIAEAAVGCHKKTLFFSPPNQPNKVETWNELLTFFAVIVEAVGDVVATDEERLSSDFTVDVELLQSPHHHRQVLLSHLCKKKKTPPDAN